MRSVIFPYWTSFFRSEKRSMMCEVDKVIFNPRDLNLMHGIQFLEEPLVLTLNDVDETKDMDPR
jgi:hypothetical protein